MIINLEKQQSKSEQYNRRNTIKISGISNEVSDQNLEETVICKDSGNEVNSLDTRVVIDYHLEGMQPTPINVSLWNSSTWNTRKLYFSLKRTLSRKVRCLFAIRYAPIIGFYGESAKNYREKAGSIKFSVLESSSG